jgi:hypothetical protein
MAGDLSELLEQEQATPSDDQKATKIPLSANGQPNLVMRPVPANQAPAPPDISAVHDTPRQAPQLSPQVTPPPKPNIGVPLQRADYKGAPIPGTQREVETPSGYQYQNTPYSYQERLNPMLGVFAKAENIGNPALRTLSRIASGIGTVANNVASGMSGQTDERAKQIAAEDKENEEKQEMGIRGAEAKEKLTSQDLVKDAQGNVVGYQQGGQFHSMAGAPKEIQDIADASAPKGGWNIKDVNIVGADGKPQAQSVMVNESKMNQLMGTPEFQQAPDKTAYLEANGAIHRMSLGQAAPSGAAAKPQYHMVPTGNGMEQLALMNPNDPTKPTMIGQPQKVGTSKLLTLVDPNDPNNVQFAQQDSKTGAITPVNSLPKGMVTPQAAGGVRHEADAFNKAYVDPAMGVEKSYDMMDQAFKEYNEAKAQGKDLPTGAQSMLALSTHLSTTFGNVKGSRITKDMIQEHLGARSVGDTALVAVQRLTNGDVLSPEQWKAFHDLIGQSREYQWKNVLEEGARRHQQIDPTWVQRAGVRTGKLDGQQVFQLNGRVFDLTGHEHTGQ